MVAPNGARKTQKDHPSLPVSIEETVAEAAACFAAGATVLHAHVRGKKEEHVLDAGLYAELIAELNQKVPDLLVQITTEAVGVYTPKQQVDCVEKVLPKMTSVALKEMTSNYTQLEFARDFYHWATEARIHIQHIVFSAEELRQFFSLRDSGIIPATDKCVLFVLGRYSVDFQSSPDDLKPFLESDIASLDWFTCAFGQQEQACVFSGIKQGGHARVGFENNFYLPGNALADNSAALVNSLRLAIEKSTRVVAGAQQARSLLGVAL